MSDPVGGTSWAPVAAVVACGSCLGSLAAGFTAFAAGFVGAFWASWLPALIAAVLLLSWVGGAFGGPGRALRCEPVE